MHVGDNERAGSGFAAPERNQELGRRGEFSTKCGTGGRWMEVVTGLMEEVLGCGRWQRVEACGGAASSKQIQSAWRFDGGRVAARAAALMGEAHRHVASPEQGLDDTALLRT